MNKYFLVALSVTGGILTSLAWTGWCSGLILLISFIPFFLIEHWLYENPSRFGTNALFIYTLPGFVIFSMISVGWMRVASITGAITVIMGLSFLMSFAFWLGHRVRQKAGTFPGYLSIITFWLSYEFISLNVNIVSPWLNLGNGLSKDIMFVQWYDITGTSGGSLWILASNLLLTMILTNAGKSKVRKNLLIITWLLVIAVPSAFSMLKYYNINPNTKNTGEVVIVQPNIDPYTEKFSIPFDEQLNKVIKMADSAVTANTTWIITPETTVDDPVNLDDLNSNSYIRTVRELAQKHPLMSVVTGFVSYRTYPESREAPTKSARRVDASALYYDHFNSALRIDTGKTVEFYHKSKLVPGIEMQFSTGPGRLISKILPNLGGTKWGYGVQEERTCLEHNITGEKIAPIICYESVFGEYVTGYINKGAVALFIITNDGWWKNTYGYKQHLDYASLRAIETRRPVYRAANTGVSCIINIKGKRTAETEWWKQAVIKGDMFSEQTITTYVSYGDWLLRIATLISLSILLSVFVVIPVRNKIK